jgi:hypothetical protein
MRNLEMHSRHAALDRASGFCSAIKNIGRMVWKSVASCSWACASRTAVAWINERVFKEPSDWGVHKLERKTNASSPRLPKTTWRRPMDVTGEEPVAFAANAYNFLTEVA